MASLRPENRGGHGIPPGAAQGPGRGLRNLGVQLPAQPRPAPVADRGDGSSRSTAVSRQQAAVLKLGKSAVRVDGWTSPELLAWCEIRFYVRAGNWSPDDKTIYLAATGLRPVSGPAPGRTSHAPGCVTPCRPSPRRRNRCTTAGSTTAGATPSTRWPPTRTTCTPAVTRAGWTTATGATPGRIRSGEPTRHRGHQPPNGQGDVVEPDPLRGRGVDQLLVTKAGLWVASDTFTDGSAQQCGGASTTVESASSRTSRGPETASISSVQPRRRTAAET